MGFFLGIVMVMVLLVWMTFDYHRARKTAQAKAKLHPLSKRRERSLWIVDDEDPMVTVVPKRPTIYDEGEWLS